MITFKWLYTGWIRRLFCKHKWTGYLYNIPTEDKNTITIGFDNCTKCAKWKLHFIFGNR